MIPKSISVVAALAFCLLGASCSKDKTEPQPAPTGTTAKFSINFPAADFTIDSIVGNYRNTSNALVPVRLLNQNSWESPVMTYTAGMTAYADIRAYGHLNGSSKPPVVLGLVKTDTGGAIEAVGSSNAFGNVYTFSGTINHAF